MDKTLLISDLLESSTRVALVVRPRRFGKTTNLTMLENFFACPIEPDNKEHRQELFIGSKIWNEKRELFDEHFCKYPVISLSLKVQSYLCICFEISMHVCLSVVPCRIFMIAKHGNSCKKNYVEFWHVCTRSTHTSLAASIIGRNPVSGSYFRDHTTHACRTPLRSSLST